MFSNSFSLPSFTAQIVATLWAFTLPPVHQSLYFHRKVNNQEVPALKSTDSLERSSCEDGKSQTSDTTTDKFQFNSVTNIVTKTPIGAKLLWQHFTNAYTNLKVVQWSIWYAVGLCGYLQVTSYVQLMWKDIEPNPDVSKS